MEQKETNNITQKKGDRLIDALIQQKDDDALSLLGFAQSSNQPQVELKIFERKIGKDRQKP